MFAVTRWAAFSRHHHLVDWFSLREPDQMHCYVIRTVQPSHVVDGVISWPMKELVSLKDDDNKMNTIIRNLYVFSFIFQPGGLRTKRSKQFSITKISFTFVRTTQVLFGGKLRSILALKPATISLIIAMQSLIRPSSLVYVKNFRIWL